MPELIAGPYNPPQCEIGSVLHDEMLGEVVVVGFQKHVPKWPLCEEPTRPGTSYGKIPVLCGDLVRAICEEPMSTIKEHWRVSRQLVTRWRQAIAGTDTGVQIALALKKLEPRFYRRFYNRGN